VGQFIAWGDLVKQTSILWVIRRVVRVRAIGAPRHAHLGGVVFSADCAVARFRYRVHSRNLSQIEMCATYWHFLDALWLYLFVFLLLNR
jgi:cytochrome c oxidase subunit 3